MLAAIGHHVYGTLHGPKGQAENSVARHTYVARTTTPGEFVVPPAKAEEAYDPETFGRSAGDRVIVY
jgi:uncharacterized protein YfaS (alpha-2-macroglobulin family)